MILFKAQNIVLNSKLAQSEISKGVCPIAYRNLGRFFETHNGVRSSLEEHPHFLYQGIKDKGTGYSLSE